MKISELINLLEKKLEEFGDLEVYYEYPEDFSNDPHYQTVCIDAAHTQFYYLEKEILVLE